MMFYKMELKRKLLIPNFFYQNCPLPLLHLVFVIRNQFSIFTLPVHQFLIGLLPVLWFLFLRTERKAFVKDFDECFVSLGKSKCLIFINVPLFWEREMFDRYEMLFRYLTPSTYFYPLDFLLECLKENIPQGIKGLA